MLSPSVGNVILVLAITRIPIYLRTTRAEVLEISERMFVQAAQVMGASSIAHRLPAHPADGDPDAGHHRDARLRLRDAGRERAVLPRHRHPAAGDHLGPDGRAGQAVPRQRLVARLLARPRDHPDHAVAQPPVELAAHRPRSRPALAARNRPQGSARMADRHLLEVRNLSVRFHTARGIVDAVEERQLAPRPRRDARHPRRERLGQVGLRPRRS